MIATKFSENIENKLIDLETLQLKIKNGKNVDYEVGIFTDIIDELQNQYMIDDNDYNVDNAEEYKEKKHHIL